MQIVEKRVAKERERIEKYRNLSVLINHTILNTIFKFVIKNVKSICKKEGQKRRKDQSVIIVSEGGGGAEMAQNSVS